MKRFILFIGLLTPLFIFGQSPCNLSDATGCDCPDGSSNCDLLPDIKASYSYTNSPSSVDEYTGEIRLGVSTTNTGYGPLRVISTDYFVCGDDTIYSPGGYSGTCADGAFPKQLIKQRIYTKDGSSMTYYDRWAGSMTYHSGHGHMHVDDWGVFTLRIPQDGVENPLDWPVVGDGTKTAFCLMDFGNCQYYDGHCVDEVGNVLTTDAPNYGLGGGSYACGLTNQGISCGYTDIYSKNLEGMSIMVPEGTCNGDYMIVIEIDPQNHFMEMSDDNNLISVPITLTEQAGAAAASISVDGPTEFCSGSITTLSASAGLSYLWSDGSTGSSINVSESGTYTCSVETVCGTVITDPVEITVNTIEMPTAENDTACGTSAITLNAAATGTINWYDAAEGGSLIHNGNTFTTPELTESTTYWIENEELTAGSSLYGGPLEHTGTSQYSGTQFNGYLIFDCTTAVMLKSVKVHSATEGNRTIELRNEAGDVLQSATINIPIGESRVTVDFALTPGINYQLGTNTDDNISVFGYESPDLRRTSGGTAFPYLIGDWVSIDNSNFGTTYYYYFYDWELQEPSQYCASPRTPVEAIIDNSPGCGLPVDCDPPVNLNSVVTSTHNAVINWDETPGSIKYQIKGRQMGLTGFATLVTSNTTKNIGGLQSGTTYEWKARVMCWNNVVSEFTELTSFTTMSPRLAEEQFLSNINMHPNPASESVFIEFTNIESAEMTIELVNVLGQILIEEKIDPQSNSGISLDIAGFIPGAYFVRIETGEVSVSKQLIISE